MVDVNSPRSQEDANRYQIVDNAQRDFEIRPPSPVSPGLTLIAVQSNHSNLNQQNVSVKPRKLSKSNSVSPIKLPFDFKRCHTIEVISVDTLEMSPAQFQAITAHRNEAMSSKIPDLQSSSTIYVCNNETLRDKTSNEYIVVKEMNKLKLKMGELAECKVDVKVHAHLLRNKLSVIQLLGWYEDDDRFCTLYEYAQNGDLLEELNILKDPFDPKWFYRARTEMKSIAKTLQFMHREGWSHKDLTLENILVDEHRNFYLHDFGLVEEFASNEEVHADINKSQIDVDPLNRSIIPSLSRRHSSIWSGKVEHMSPENYDTYMGNMQMFDAFSNDVWGLGVIVMCCFSTQTFLWNAPDKKQGSYQATIKKIDTKLQNAFMLDKQQDNGIKAGLLQLIDLLKRIFVDEIQRIDIDQVLEHPFFSEDDSSWQKESLVNRNRNADVKRQPKKPCSEYCTIL